MRMQRHTLKNLIAGFLIGIGCILPGVSGGVMAVSFGLYRPMLDSLLHFWDKPKERISFLLPLVIGGGCGMLLGATVLSAAMSRHRSLMMFLFIGLILGGLPELWHEAQKEEPFRPVQLLWPVLGAAIALPLVWLGAGDASIARFTPVQALAAGLLEGVGTVVPGISTSFVLIRLGWYQAYLQALSGMLLPDLVFLGAGFALSAFACMKAVSWLFDHASGPAHLTVMGFLLVSILLVFPGFHQGRLLWADAGLLLIGLAASRWLAHLTVKRGE